ncbi:hypothetical protein L2E82_48010 [Cichorium intybus]|uniref:Uncharacterized protein n=1 Tax=Cichorium intybus TaxID=13427 RepID=A0ACB8YX48_CICIN|nr:hypothetical protein L2E82_48010 [Cichorium intybus]
MCVIKLKFTLSHAKLDEKGGCILDLINIDRCFATSATSDAEEQVEMIRCCICEDWFDEEHLGLGNEIGST